MAEKTQLGRIQERAGRKEKRIGKKTVRKLGEDTPQNRQLVKDKLANRKQRTKEFIRMGVGLPNKDGLASKVETAKYNLATEKMKASEVAKKSAETFKKIAEEDIDTKIPSMQKLPPLKMKPVTSLIKRNI